MGNNAPSPNGPAVECTPEQPPGEVRVEPLQLDEENPPPARTKLRLTAILTALYLALFIGALDQTIVATAIPTISSTFHSTSGFTWIGSAYTLANAAAGPIWARSSDIWGRKPAIMAAVALFAGASALAGGSTRMDMLIAARALQGVAGGGLFQLVFITISDLFSMRRRTLYLGFTEMVWAVAGGAGPLIGGAFTESVSWRWCFWINLPVCGLTWLLLLVFLDVHNPKTKLREGLMAIDWFGTFSILAVTLMVLLGLDFGGAIFPWSSPKVICLIVFGAAMIGFFLFSEKRLARYPLMPLGMFRRSTIPAFVIGIVHGMVFIVVEFYMPLYFQSAKQASPLRSGLLILPVTISEAVMGIAVGLAMHQTGRYREIIWLGLVILTAGVGSFISFTAATPLARQIGLEVLYGGGAGLLFEAPIICIQNSVSQADTAMATGTFSFLRNVAASVSIVAGGVVFQNGMKAQAHRLRTAGLDSAAVDVLAGSHAAASIDMVGSLPTASQRTAAKDAFARSFQVMWTMYTSIAALGVIFGCFIQQEDLRKGHTETKTAIENMTERV